MSGELKVFSFEGMSAREKWRLLFRYLEILHSQGVIAEQIKDEMESLLMGIMPIREITSDVDTHKWRNFDSTEAGKVLKALKGLRGRNVIRGHYARGQMQGTLDELRTIANGEIEIDEVGERTRSRLITALAEYEKNNDATK